VYHQPMETYKRNQDGSIEYMTDLLGNKIPVPDLGTGSMAVRYEGFDSSNLHRNASAGWYKLIGLTQKTANASPKARKRTPEVKQDAH